MSDIIILPFVYAMTGFRQRLWGLIRQPEPAASEAYWFPRCKSVHTFGMKAPIDIVGLDRDHRIQRVERHVCPNQIKTLAGCTSVLELGSYSPWPFERWLGRSFSFIRQGMPHDADSAKNHPSYFAIAINFTERLSSDGRSTSTATADL